MIGAGGGVVAMMMQMILPMVTQFGAAGLIGLLWLIERRAAAQRERALSEAHDRLMQERQALTSVLEVVRENTRATAALERTQAQLVRWLERAGERVPRGAA